MERYLIDTNVVCDYLTAELPHKGLLLLDTVMDTMPQLSVITQIELLCWNAGTEIENSVRNFIIDSTILHINTDVIMYCVALRKSKKIKTPDAIIAATALAYDITLLTNNEKDFTNIRGLKLINPYKL
ncbi:motility twitching protein PilT [Bacteroidia bacterium]|nr:motility twitching protein PilT [Bacteroidia bacterium]